MSIPQKGATNLDNKMTQQSTDNQNKKRNIELSNNNSSIE